MLIRMREPPQMVVLFLLLGLLLVGCRGAVPAEEDAPADELGETETEDIPSGAREAVEDFWHAFSAGDRDVMLDLLSDQLKDELRFAVGLRTLASAHHIAHGSPVFNGFEELEVSVRTGERQRDRVTVEVVIRHPAFPAEEYEEFADALEGEVRSTAARGDDVDFRAEFSRLLEAWEVPTGETDLTMNLRESRNRWQIVGMKRPAALFSSFLELREIAVCNGLREAYIFLADDEPLAPETPVIVDFRGEELTVQNARRPECAVRMVVLDIADEVEVSAARLIDSLAQHPFDWEGLHYYLQMGPEDFLHSGEFLFNSDHTELAVALTRPYAVATKDTALGVVDVLSEEVRFLDVISGTPEILAWSPDDEHLACAWVEWGPGFNEVHVYTEGEKVRFTEILGEELTDPVQELRWSADGMILEIDVRREDDRLVTWSLDLGQRDLQSK